VTRPKSSTKPKAAAAFRLSAEAHRLLDLIAEHEGASKTYTVEMLIRQGAKRRGLG
jgi:predicted DNA-binding protein